MDLLLAGRSASEVAAELRVDRRTVNRWREDPVFDEEFQERQREISDTVHATLVSQSVQVAGTLATIALDDSVDDKGHAVISPMARVNAVRVFFELLGRHKNAPVAKSERGADPETLEDVLEVMAAYPTELLEMALGARQKKRRPKSEPKTEKTL